MYAYLLSSSYSTPSQQLLNEATKSVLTPSLSWTKLHYNLTKLQLKTADIVNNLYGVRRQNYGELKNAGHDNSINVFSILSWSCKLRAIER